MGKWLTSAAWLLATLLVVGAVFPEIHENDGELSRELKKAVRDWTSRSEPFEAPTFGNNEDAGIHRRSKRSALQSNPNGGCLTPGYTGQHCEFPICDNYVQDYGMEDNEMMTIDFGFSNNVTTPLYFPVDKELKYLEIQMDTSEPVRPSFSLQGPDGKTVTPIADGDDGNARFMSMYNTLKPGTYVVVPTAENLLTPAFTIIHVRALSPLKLMAGFIPADANNGAPERFDVINKTVVQGQANVVAAKVFGLPRPGSVATFSIMHDQYQKYLTHPQPLQIRYGCSFEYFYEMFVCNTPGTYLMKFEGYDFWGYSFSRVSSFRCEVAIPTPSSPPPSTSPQPVITECFHGGHLIKDPKDNTSSCFCEPLFTGPDCRVPVCLHGGRPAPAAPVCTCAKSFFGNHCEHVKCADNAGIENSLKNPSLVLVLRVRQQMNDVITQVNAYLKLIAAELEFDPEYLQHIIVVTFNNGKLWGSKQFSSIDAVNEDLKKIATSTDDSGGCVDTVYSAISEVFAKYPIALKSPIYVFTDAMPSDYDQLELIYSANAYFYSPIYFMLVQNPTLQACENDRYGKAWRAMEGVSVRSGGMVFDPIAAGDIGKFFERHMYSTFYRSQLVYENDLRVCSEQPALQTIAVDQNLEQLVIIAQGSNLSLTLLNPSGKQVKFSETLSQGSAYFWAYSGPIAGQWSFKLSADKGTPCQYRAYGLVHKDKLAKDREYKMVWGFTNADVVDAPFRVPVVGFPLRLVAHVQGYEVPSMFENAEVAIYANHDKGRELVFAANSVWRDGCSFEIEFPAYTCYHPNEDLYFNLYFRDRRGNTVQRAGHFYCAYMPVTINPPEGCQNGGVNMNGTCICPPLWNGKNCETRVCLNGGTNVHGTYCECLPGHVGASCETVSCITQGDEPKVDFGNKFRSMIILLDLSTSNAYTLQELKTFFPHILRDFKSHHERWIEDYTVIGYNSTWHGVLTNAKWDNQQPVVDAIGRAYDLSQQYPDPHCQVKMWEAIQLGIEYSGVNGYINVFQGGLPNENDNVGTIITAYDSISVKRLRFNTFLGFKNKGQAFCQANRTSYDLLEELVALSEGQFFPLSVYSFKNALNTLPAMYMQNMVDRRSVADCTVPQTFYISMDTYAQSTQITVFGYVANLTVFKPNGTKADFNLLTEVINDDNTGTYMYELRKPCPSEWQPVGKAPYCAHFGIQNLTWTEARDYCKQAGGFLADEMYPDKADFLDMDAVHLDHWFGLNDLAQNGVWMWDRGARAEAPLADANHTYRNWAAGEPANDANRRCGARLYKNGATNAQWYSANCAEKRAFICQRHKFSDRFEPLNLDDDDLPSGKWRVELYTEAQTFDGQSYPECFYEVRTQSKIGIISGFALDEHSDKSSGFPTSGTDKNIFITHLTGTEVAAVQPKLTYSIIYDLLNRTMSAGTTYQRRENCQYEWFSQNFDCPNGDNPKNGFAAIHTGEDEFGVSFQRLTTGHCKKPTMFCGNGGVIYKGQCVCDEFWTGADCNTPVCVNGGMLDVVRNKCFCLRGFTGDACQWPLCNAKVPYNFDNDGKTFAMVVENTQANKDALDSLRSEIKNVLTDANNASKTKKWFKNYMLVTFTTDGQSRINEYPDLDSFVNGFQQYTQNPDHSAQKCSYPIFTLLADVMAHENFVKPNSVLYLVSRGMPNDLKEGALYFDQMGAQSRAQFFVKLVMDPACKIKGMETVLAQYAYTSNGNFFYVPPKDVGKHMQSYLPAVYGSSVLSTPTIAKFQCSQLLEEIQVDRETTDLFLTLYMDKYAPIGITDPFGATITPVTLSQSNNTHIISIKTPNPGLYTFFFNSSSQLCMIQIRGKNGPQVFTGFVDASKKNANHIDNIQTVPAPNANNIIVAHSTSPAKLTMVEFFGVRSNNTEAISFVQLNARWGCSFEFYSEPFQCPAEVFVAFVHGIDFTGTTFRRMAYFSCLGLNGTVPTLPPYTTPAPTTPPTVSTTLAPTTTPMTPKTIVADIFLLVDASADMNNDTYQKEMVNFIVKTFNYFDLSQTGLKFSIFAVDGNDGMPNDKRYSLGPVSDPAFLRRKLVELGDVFLSTMQGQKYLKDTLDLITNKNLINDHSFTAVNNRLVMYFTSSSSPTPEAIAKATAMRSNGQFGFMTVAYKGDGANVDSLKSFSGGADCSFATSDVNQLDGIGSKIQKKIWAAALANNAQYC
ncbi:hypothetical protein QR680_018043 [Steinernema hermaphroditum]|uniref:Uncharacterized protein n=1 Tax=Steinernema hermaphroditum TaxID=289476 RepID=A0AA39HGQ4_9BILA|nr:hypothetical protein QR680_018043 [Steinernema hermaphroditum]